MGCALMGFSERDKRDFSDHTACDKRKNPGTAALPKFAVPILRAPRLFGRKNLPAKKFKICGTSESMWILTFSEACLLRSMNARNGSELALFNDCFELKDGERITASKLCEIMKLRGYKKYDNHLYKWLDAHFADHEFVRKIRPRNVRTWLGIKPRVALKRCNACGASCIARVAVAG